MKRVVLLAVIALLVLGVSACNAGSWKVQVWITGADGTVVSKDFGGEHAGGLKLYDLGAVDFGIYGICDELSVELDEDPAVVLHFSYVSGIAPVQSFSGHAEMDIVPVLDITSAVASGGVTLTEGQDSLPNATITGNYPNNKIWRAVYNSSVIYADLVTGRSLVLDTEDFSEECNDPIPVPVNKIAIDYDFSLTDGDTASGTGRFRVLGEPVPEPSSILALATGGIGLLGFAARKKRA